MPGDKIPIPQFAAKIKAKYPEYKDVNDTLLVQKIIAKYPEYKEQVEFEPAQIQEPVKKKEETGGIGSVIGGAVGSSATPSEKGFAGKLFDLAKLQQAEKETYDPVSEATKPHRDILAEAQGETKQLIPSLQRSDATTVKPYVDINTALQKANTIRDIETNAFPDISTAIQWKDKMDSGALSPKNRTTQLARKIVTDAENTVSALKNTGADYDKGAIEYAMSSNDAFGEAIRKMVKDGKPLDDFVKGEAAMRYLGSRFFRELPDNSPVKQGVIAAAKEAQQKYPSMYFQQLNEKISAKREEMEMNNWFYNDPGIGNTDKAMDALRKEGKISDGEEMAYINAYRPMMQAGINPGIKTPGFVESTGESISHQLKSAVGLLEDVGEATGASRLYSTVGGDIRRELREQQQMIKEPNWSYGHQVSRAAGNLTGLIATMGGEGAVLKGLGLGANATNAVATGLNFFHDIYKAEEQKHGKGDPMAYLSALTQTVLWSEGTKIFGNAFNDVIKSSKGEVNDILKSLQDGTIQNSDATQSIMNVLLNKITKGGKEAIKDVAKIKGIEVLNGTLSNLFNGQLDIKTPINDALHDTPTFFLSLLPVKVMGAKGKDMTKEYLSSLVKYPELAENITDPKAKQNYESLVKLEPFLDEQGLNDKQKDNYRLLYLKGKLMEEQSGALPDKGLSGELEKNIKENEIAKKAVVDPEMGNKKIVQEFYDNDLLDKGSKMMLENEEGKFSESKVGEYLKSIAQQENGLDENWKPLEGGSAKLKGRIPDTIIELANERWKKEIEAAKPKEEIKEPEAPKIKGTPEDISQPIELSVEPITVTEGKEQPSEASTGLSRGDEISKEIEKNKKRSERESELLYVERTPNVISESRKIAEERFEERKKIIPNASEGRDSKYDEVHDAILTDGEMPDGYSAVVVDSYYEPVMRQNHTIAKVFKPTGETFYVDVNTYKRVEFGKTYGDPSLSPNIEPKPITEDKGAEDWSRDVESTAKAFDDLAKIKKPTEEQGKKFQKIKDAYYPKDSKLLHHGSSVDKLEKDRDGLIWFTDQKKVADEYRKRNIVSNEANLDEYEPDILESKSGVDFIADEQGINLNKGKIFSGMVKLEKPLDLTYNTDDGNISNIEEFWNNLSKRGLVEKWEDIDEEYRDELKENYEGKALWRLLEDENIYDEAKKKRFDGVIISDVGTDGNIHKSYGLFNLKNYYESSPQGISEAYHKAKTDGSNPELVKAVEDLLGEPKDKEAEQPTVTTKEQVSNEAVIPEGAKSPEPIPTKEESTTGEVPVEVSKGAKTLAEKVRSLKVDLSKLSGGGLQSNVLGLPAGVWNGAMELVAKTIEAGGEVVDAVKKGLKYIQSNHRGQWDKKGFNDQVMKELGLRGITVNGEDFVVKDVDREFAPTINGFYSDLEQTILDISGKEGKPEAWISALKGDEAKWTGLHDWLKSLPKDKKVTKQEVQQFLKDNRIQVVEVVKGEVSNFTKEDIADVKINQHGAGNWVVKTKEDGTVEFPLDKADDKAEAIEYALEQLNYDNKSKRESKPKFQQYQLEGAKENYREVLVTLPKAKSPIGKWEYYKQRGIEDAREFENLSVEKKRELFEDWKKEVDKTPTRQEFKSSHFDEPNILVHLRMNSRTDAEGKKILFLEEIQGDFPQEYRKQQNLVNDYIDKNSTKVIEAFKKKGILEVICP